MYIFVADNKLSLSDGNNCGDEEPMASIDNAADFEYSRTCNVAAKKMFATITNESRSSKKTTQHKEKKGTMCIDVDAHKSADNKDSTWWIENLQLLDSDRAILTTDAWIGAPIINASQYVYFIQAVPCCV